MATFLTISGSPSPRSATEHVLSAHVIPRLAALGHTAERVVLRDLPAAALLSAHAHHPRVLEAAELLAAADGVVVATPVYKAAYSGLLKVFLDVMPRSGLAGKRALQLVVGHSAADGRLAHEALHTVLLSMGATAPPGRCFLTSDAAREPARRPHTSALRELDAELGRLCASEATTRGRRAA